MWFRDIFFVSTPGPQVVGTQARLLGLKCYVANVDDKNVTGYRTGPYVEAKGEKIEPWKPEF